MTKDQIKSNCHIKDLVRALSLPIQKEQGHNLIMNSLEINKQRTGSMIIYADPSQGYYDFATSKGGDIFQFYATYAGLDVRHDFVKVLKDLNNIFDPNNSQVYTSQAIKVDKVYSSNKIYGSKFAQIYEEMVNLCQKDIPNNLITDRKLNLDILKANKIGSTVELNRFEVVNHFKKRFNISDLKECGLFKTYSNSDNLYFNYTNHILIPYYNNGTCVFLQFRSLLTADELSEKGLFKYSYLKGIEQQPYKIDILASTGDSDIIFVTEGAIDVLSLESHGLKGFACGSASAALKTFRANIEFIKNNKATLILAFDSDEAGLKATNQIKEYLISEGVLSQRIAVLKLPIGIKDINDLLINNLCPQI
jgi:DNA primase